MVTVALGPANHATLAGVVSGQHQAAIPAGIVGFFNGDCPSGWSELTAARGRYIVATPLNGTDAGAVGTALSDVENRQTGQHTHVFTGGVLAGHGHTFTGEILGTHGHNLRGRTGVGDTNTQAGNNHAPPSEGFGYRDASTNVDLDFNAIKVLSAGTPAGTLDSVTGGTPAGTNANAGAVAATNAPYIQLTCCEKD